MKEDITCHYCGMELFFNPPPGKEALRPTRDHVVARARGGLDERWNRQWACAACNIKKADSWSDAWSGACFCAFCMRTRRRHWEMLGIRNPNPPKRYDRR
jgi:hypothetical protein